MNNLHIKAAIVKAGTSQAAIAIYLGVTPTSVNRVVAGTLRSQRIENELEKIIGPGMFPPKCKPGRKKTQWTGKLPSNPIAPVWDGVERRVSNRRASAA